MLNGLMQYFWVVVFCLALGGLFWAHIARARQILARWAQRNQLQILQRQYCFLARGPFWWRSSNSHAVFYVVVRDKFGFEKSGWVRCGAWLWGLLSDRADVVWNE